jgi:hypothetical protein
VLETSEKQRKRLLSFSLEESLRALRLCGSSAPGICGELTRLAIGRFFSMLSAGCCFPVMED